MPFDFHIAFTVQADFGVGVQVQGQFFAEHSFGFFQHDGVGNAADQAAFTEDFNFHAQSGKCLSEFQTDDARAEDGNAFRQGIP